MKIFVDARHSFVVAKVFIAPTIASPSNITQGHSFFLQSKAERLENEKSGRVSAGKAGPSEPSL
jgi:hypothetical protein